MLTLSRLCLNLQSDAVRRDLLDPYQLHRTLARAFAGPRAEAGLLYRLELGMEDAIVLAQSRVKPDWSGLPDGYLEADEPARLRRWAPRLAVGQALRFRLRANPTFKRGRRRLAWLREEQQLGWLARQGQGHGFALLQATALREGFVQMARPGRRRVPVTCYAVLYDGFLSIAEPVLLAAAVRDGLGAGKAFGFGLLSLAPA